MDTINNTEILLKLNDHDNQLKNLNRRVDKYEKNSEALNELALSVHDLAVSVKNMSEKQIQQDTRLANLESKPAKRWESFVQLVITTLVGAVLGFLLTWLGLK